MSEVNDTDWNKIHKEREQKREKIWDKYMQQIKAIAIIVHIKDDFYRVFLPYLGQCDYYVKTDRLTINKNGISERNGFKFILKNLDLYIFDGKICERKKDLNK